MDEKACGLMTGIAVGNLLGLPYEGWPREWIAREHPGGIMEIDAVDGWDDDDDVAQSILIAEAAAKGPLDVADLGRRLSAWEETNGSGIGLLTAEVLSLYQGGMPIVEASRMAWNGERAGNGAVTRCAPLAIRWRDDTTALVRNSIISAAPTHWDPRCGWSCAILNLAIASTLSGQPVTADALLDTGLNGMHASLPELEQYGYDANVPDAVGEAVVEASKRDLEDLRLDGGDMGYTLLALRVGLISLWRAPDFEQGLRRVIEAGGDTDTNGAIVGAVLGARFGVEAIPECWREKVRRVRRLGIPMESYANRLVAGETQGGE